MTDKQSVNVIRIDRQGVEDNFVLKSDYDLLLQELKDYREALEFYSKKENYTELHDYKGLHKFTLIGENELQDNGKLAKSVLEKYKVKE